MNPDKIREEERRLAENENLLKEAQDGQELLSTSQGLMIEIEPSKDRNKVNVFFRDIMDYAGRITQSIKPDGNLTERFVAMGPIPVGNNLGFCLSCFNRGFSQVEFALVYTKAHLLATKYGLKIERMDKTPSLDHQMYRTQPATPESDIETRKDGRKIVAEVKFPDGTEYTVTAVVNDQFRTISPTEIIFIMMETLMTQQTTTPGKVNLGQFVRDLLDRNPKLLRLQAERMGREQNLKIISEEKVEEKDLGTATCGNKSFAVWALPKNK